MLRLDLGTFDAVIAPALLIVALLLVGPASAAGPFGGTVTSITVGEDGRTPRWATTSRGLFRFNRGEWNRVGSLGQSDLTALVETPELLLVAKAHDGLMSSPDEGATWNPVVRGLRGRYGHSADEVLCLTQSREDPWRLYVGAAGQGVFESVDGGRNWTLLHEGLEHESPQALHPTVVLPPRAERPLLMGTDGRGVFALRGGRWVTYGDGLPGSLRARVLEDDPSDPLRVVLGTFGQGLWESRDGGRSWHRLRRGRHGVVEAVTVGSDGEVLVHFPEEGLTWLRGGKDSRRKLLKRARVKALTALRGGGWLAGLEHDGVVEISAQGEVRRDWNSGLDATRVLALANGRDGSALWTGDANGVFFSPDGGRTWEARDRGLSGAPARVILWHRGRLFLGSGGHGVFAWSPERMSWEGRSNGLGTANTIGAFVEDADGEKLYVGTEGGVLRSDDGGVHWQRKSNGLPHVSGWLVAASRRNPETVWASGAGRLYWSKDSGDSWSALLKARPVALEVHLSGGEEQLLVLEPDRLFSLVGGTLDDVPLEADEGESLNCIASTADKVWVGGTRGLWVVAGGQARKVWEAAGVQALLPTPDGVLFAGTDGRGVLRFRIQ